MKTYSANAIAEQFERDRGVVVRALRNTAPDAMVFGKAQWKIATAALALERHRTGTTSATTSTANPPECAVFDQAFSELVALPELSARRTAAVEIVPLLNAMVAAVGAAGEDRDRAGARGDVLYQNALAGFREACGWTYDEAWHHLNADADAGAE